MRVIKYQVYGKPKQNQKAPKRVGGKVYSVHGTPETQRALEEIGRENTTDQTYQGSVRAV